MQTTPYIPIQVISSWETRHQNWRANEEARNQKPAQILMKFLQEGSEKKKQKDTFQYFKEKYQASQKKKNKKLKVLFSFKQKNMTKRKKWEIFWDVCTHIGVELPHKAWEVVVLEVVGQDISWELRGSPHHKGGVIFTPWHNVISAGIINKLIGFGEERSRNWFVWFHGQHHLSTALHQGHNYY